MENGLVSIVMPTYNRADVLSRSVESVLSQTWTRWELLIIDDGSTDDTAQRISAFADVRVRYFRLPENHGANYARNVGLREATGEYFAFLDSDNVWKAEYLENRLTVLQTETEVGGVFGYTRLMRDDVCFAMVPSEEAGNELLKEYPQNNRSMIRLMLFQNIIDTNTIVLKRCCVEKSGGFDESLGRLQDWDYFFRVLCVSGERLRFTGDCLVTNYLREDSLSRKENDGAYWQARVNFLRKYKSVFLEYDCLAESLGEQFFMMSPCADDTTMRQFFSLLQKGELEEVLLSFRQRSFSMMQWLENLQKIVELRDRELRILDLYQKWTCLMQNGHRLGPVITAMGFKAISVYGYGRLGQTLCRELAQSECSLLAVIDGKQQGQTRDTYQILGPDEIPEASDVVVVTALYDFEAIRKQYEKDIPFVSLEEVVTFAETYYAFHALQI